MEGAKPKEIPNCLDEVRQAAFVSAWTPFRRRDERYCGGRRFYENHRGQQTAKARWENVSTTTLKQVVFERAQGSFGRKMPNRKGPSR